MPIWVEVLKMNCVLMQEASVGGTHFKVAGSKSRYPGHTCDR